MGRRAGVATLAALFLAGLGGPAQAGEAHAAAGAAAGEGAIGIQLLDAPVDRRGDPRALRYIVDHLAPGAAIERHVQVVNKTDQPQRIDVYPAAATIEKEQFLFGAGHAINELTSWISLDGEPLDLPPGESAKLLVTIQVPPAASAGERYAVIWASVASDPNAGAIVQVNRVGVRVYLDIGAGGEPTSDFDMGRFVAARGEDGRPTVSVPVTNTGGRALDLSGSAFLTEGPGGTNAGPFRAVQGATLGPGQTGTVVIGFSAELANGPWQVKIDIESGIVRHSATERLSFPNAGGPDRTGVLALHPLIIAGGFLLAVLLVLACIAILVRRSRSAVRSG